MNMIGLFSVPWIEELLVVVRHITHNSVSVVVGLLVIFFTKYLLRTREVEKKLKNIPGPPVWPIIGNAHLFFGLDAEGCYKKWFELQKLYGRTFRFWFGSSLWVSLSEPQQLGVVLSSDYATNKDKSYRFFADVSKGLFTANGEEWKKLRKLVNPTFDLKLLEGFMDCFNDESKVLVNLLEERVDGPEFDIHEYVARCTIDIITGTQMGVTSYEQSKNTSDFAKNLSNSIEITKERVFKLYLQPDIIFSHTPLSRKKMEFNHQLHKYVHNIIQQRKQAKTENDSSDYSHIDGKKKNIYLDSILNHFKNLSDDEMILKVCDMFVGGSDTTSVVISSAIMLLGVYPDIQDKVYKEVIEVIGSGDEDITCHHLPKFTYLEMVLKEVLRHFAVPDITRLIHKDLLLGDSTIPAGTTIFCHFYRLHRDPSYWSNPDEFYPDHFLPENVAKRPKFSYLPFSYGPRNCPGRTFGMMSMKVIVAAIIRKYRIRANFDFKKGPYRIALLVEPVEGYSITISKR